jgi:hypothetical protein
MTDGCGALHAGAAWGFLFQVCAYVTARMQVRVAAHYLTLEECHLLA